MEILTGLFDHMVLQRGGPAVVTGRATSDVVAHVGRRAFTAKTRNGSFTLKLNLPAGGPYTVRLTAGKEKLVVKDVLVGDVWICAGQSNMQGVGWLRHADKPVKNVRAFYMDDRWAVARDPIHNLHECVDEAHIIISGGVRPGKPTHWGVGPAVAFGQEMLRRTRVPQGLLACAHGGTSMDQWSPAKKSEGGRSLYGAMLRRVVKNGGRVAGMIWYQGESDTGTKELADAYLPKMREFIGTLRRDLRAARLPVAMVQIGRFITETPNCWNAIQDQQRRLPDVIPNLVTVPAVDLPLDDNIHIGGTGNTRLGRRLADALLRPPLVVKKATVQADKTTGAGLAVIEFGNVVGRLVSAGRPTGFDLGSPNVVFDTVLDGNKVYLRTLTSALNLRSLKVSYGAGANPYCNVTDTGDRGVPVFGPLGLGEPAAATGALKPRVTELFPGAGKLKGLTLPANLTWREKPFPTEFCNLHDELDGGDKLVFYRCDLHVNEPMKLAALLGYDGPVKLWVDGRELFHDPHGTNPAIPEAKRIRFDVGPGKHELVIALGSNHGLAWGIFLRIQRLDVSRQHRALGPTSYAMPAIS